MECIAQRWYQFSASPETPNKNTCESASTLLVWGDFIPTLGRPVSFSSLSLSFWGIVLLDIPYYLSREKHAHETLLHKVNDGTPAQANPSPIPSPSQGAGTRCAR